MAPGTPAGMARQVVRSLREMDPDLPIFSFLDPAALGTPSPPATALGDIDPAKPLGGKILRQRLLAGIHRARS